MSTMQQNILGILNVMKNLILSLSCKHPCNECCFYSINPKSTGLFSFSTALGVFSIPICKIKSRHFKELKLTWLIAYIMFYKICEFESLTITNDVIMTSLPKTMAKCGPPLNQTNYISFERY